MRAVQTFVLRLFVDTLEPQALRGSLISVINGDEHPFSDRASFFELLDQLTHQPPVADQENDTKIKDRARPHRKQGVENG